MEFWKEVVALSLASRRKLPVLALCNSFSELKLILSYECPHLILLSLRGLRLAAAWAGEMPLPHCWSFSVASSGCPGCVLSQHYNG